MNASYHRQITQTALFGRLNPSALQVVTRGNLQQDRLAGLLFHPEYHFDDNHFRAGEAYLLTQRRLAVAALTSQDPARSWLAFGRLTHAAQDFYAHTNYVQLYLETHPDTPPAAINPREEAVLAHPRLCSGKVHWGWELLFYFSPRLGEHFRDRVPADSHAAMNLDDPSRGLLFAYAVQAAIKRTELEFDLLMELLDPSARQLFGAQEASP